jgi:hypothetical protein
VDLVAAAVMELGPLELRGKVAQEATQTFQGVLAAVVVQEELVEMLPQPMVEQVGLD